MVLLIDRRLLTRAIAVVGSAIALCGCFKSDYPLMNPFDSVTPVPEGNYSYLDDNKVVHHAVIIHQLTATKLIMYDDGGKPTIHTLFMKDEGEGYYLVMDEVNSHAYNYSYADIRNGEITEFAEQYFCDDLRDAAEEVGDDLSEYDATSNDADESICTFSSLDGLEKALNTLEERGDLKIGRTFHPE